MKKILTLIITLSCTHQPLNVIQNLPDVQEHVKINPDHYNKRIGEYVINHQGHLIKWAIRERKKTSKLTLTLKIQQLDKTMQLSFDRQKILHHKILSFIFSKWDKYKITQLTTEGLGRIETLGTWSIPIALKANKSQEWHDYRKNYPKRQVKKSSNQLFVEFANQANAYNKLSLLFNQFGLDLKLKNVEKVFAQKAQQLNFYPELKRLGVIGNPRLIYDAGIIYFDVFALPSSMETI